MRDTFHSAVSLVCRILPDELVFLSVGDAIMTACVPIDRDASPEIPEIECMSGGRLFSFTVNTSFDDIKKAGDMLLGALEKEAISPISNLRIYSALTPYTDDMVEKRDIVMRVGVLIK